MTQSADGKFLQANGWVFNNLTYAASSRTMWKTNPLGNYGSWVASDGRMWRTECDTPTTGRNGCRTYVRADIIESYAKPTGDRAFRWVNTWVFNNMVRFTAPAAKPTLPPGTIDPASIADPTLRECISEEAGVKADAPIPEEELKWMFFLDCSWVRSLRGMPELPNLETLVLRNTHFPDLTEMPTLPKLDALDLDSATGLSSLEGMPALPMLRSLSVRWSSLSSFKGMPVQPNLQEIEVDASKVRDFQGMPVLPELVNLGLSGNQLRSLQGLPLHPQLSTLLVGGNLLSTAEGLPELPSLTILSLTDNRITTMDDLPHLPALRQLSAERNRLRSVAGLSEWTHLEQLYLHGNLVEDLEKLQPLVDAGVFIDIWPY